MREQYLYTVSEVKDHSLLGVKGQNLRGLLQHRFPVPLTTCLVTHAYDDFIEARNLQPLIRQTLENPRFDLKEKSQRIMEMIMEARVPTAIFREINERRIFNKFNIHWAVRSSSNMEDLQEASFAGLYDSFLNVTGVENVTHAIQKCWASLWSERAISYRETNKLAHDDAKMAVIIQEMVSAKFSGVLFTEDPNVTSTNTMVLEYCEGLGEGLVSGTISPYSCKISKLNQRVRHGRSPQEREFSDEAIAHLATLAKKIEFKFGSPQDIEWAYDGNEFYFLQTRPIATKPRSKIGSIDTTWTRANVGEVLPNVVTPLTWEIFQATLLGRPELALEPESVPDEIYRKIRQNLKRFHGRVYIRVKDFLNSFCYLPFVTPETMGRVLGAHFPWDYSSYKRPGGGAVRLAQLLFLTNAVGIFPRIAMMVKKLPPPPDPNTSTLADLIQWNASCFRLHLKCTAYAIGSFALLSYVLDRWMPDEARELLPLILVGTEHLQTAAQGFSIWELANYVRQSQALQAVIHKDLEWPEAKKVLDETVGGPQFLTMLQSFLDANGARAAGEFELAVPRWREDPSFVLSVMRRFIDTPQTELHIAEISARRMRRKDAIDRIDLSLNKVQRTIFQRLLKSYSEFSTLRENMKYRLIEGYSHLRELFVKKGALLASRGMIAEPDDIFFLTPTEVLTLLAKGAIDPPATELIEARQELHNDWQRIDAPDLILADGQEVVGDRGAELRGIGCSPGMVEGTARVLLDLSDASSLQTGEILVAPHTDPGWTPLFLSCKAVVTEIGGFLSHGATVAREYGIPAVVNVQDATTKIQTGDQIRVNGTNGLVTIVDA